MVEGGDCVDEQARQAIGQDVVVIRHRLRAMVMLCRDGTELGSVRPVGGRCRRKIGGNRIHASMSPKPPAGEAPDVCIHFARQMRA